MPECVFCDIADGRAPARIIYRDDIVLGFLDIHPVRPGHTLLIPRDHHSGLGDLPSRTGGALFDAAQKVGLAMRTSMIAADGVNLVMNDGKAAFQTVFHCHLHVIPRHHGDKVNFAKGLVIRRDPHPDATAATLASALSDH